ncbi:hypothetical protein ACHQM5_024605 [Ranunculus cassubicifolius]
MSDYSSSYHHQFHQHQNPNPNNDLHPNPNPLTTYASAPPFASSDYPNYPSSYSQIPDPTAPSYLPNYQSPFNPQPSSYLPPPPPSAAPEQQPPLPYLAAAAAVQPPPPAPQQQQPPFYQSYDQHSNYTPPTPIVPPNPVLNYSASYPNSYGNINIGSSVTPPVYESPYDNRAGYVDNNASRYGAQVQQPPLGRSQSDGGGVDFYDKRPENGFPYHQASVQQEDVRRDNIYAYTGGKVEPYGARGTGGKSSSYGAPAAFDDYGRSLSHSAKDQPSLNKVLKAVPKAETQQDVKNGVQKFRVKLLPETGGQPMDVLCQIGLDGIRMLDPSTGRTLRIYPLETITRSEVLDSSIFAFWSKSTVDIEPRRIRLKSSSYTTNTILDTVTAATFQLKEIGGKDTFSNKQSDPGRQLETEKKKGFSEWVNSIKPGNEEKDHWVPDEAVTKCTSCGTDFGAFVRRHHCRNCGDIFCDKCTNGRIALTAEENAQPVRVCDRCLAEVTQRLSNAKESASRPAALCSHEDLAKKLQEEMDKNRKASSGGSKSSSGGKRMREVACPTCTVHLQVQVPASGSETIECGVCQHPFLVSA